MFTGLIEAVGHVRSSTPDKGGLRLHIAVGTLPFADVAMGESIAVSGCCLTVVAFDADSFAADVSSESLACTALGQLREGDAVNLERAMRADGRFGGHVVSGHVDGIATVSLIESIGGAQRWRFEAPFALLRYIAVKGSVCVDGVSLTVNAVDDAGFEVALIPHTLAHTAFGSARIGTQVNLEIDLMARYVERLQATSGSV